MSLYGVMRTGVSGMNAQANRLSTVADNVANVNTTGYKAASCEFSSLLLNGSDPSYECGAVLTTVRHHISAQGSLANTSSSSDLAISGGGFFVVADAAGVPYLTRAGSFVADGSGVLVNAAGFQLLGYKVDPTAPGATLGGLESLVPVNLKTLPLTATPSTAGDFAANLPAAASVIPGGNLPSMNGANSTYTAKSSLISFDSLGGEVKLDIYFAKMGDGSWEMSVFDASGAAPGGGFPYASPPLVTQEVDFAGTGKPVPASPASVSFTIPGGADFTLGIAGLTQFSTGYVVLQSSANGAPAAQPKKMEFARDGFIYAVTESGLRVPVYRIPLGQVMSPDQLTPLAGNVFSASAMSGDLRIGFPEEGGLGSIASSTLEQSTVDIAGELTAMIDAQRSYTANSKVFQTGSELMDVLVNLKR